MGNFISRRDLKDIREGMSKRGLKRVLKVLGVTVMIGVSGVAAFQLGSYALDYFHQ